MDKRNGIRVYYCRNTVGGKRLPEGLAKLERRDETRSAPGNRLVKRAAHSTRLDRDENIGQGVGRGVTGVERW